MATHPYLKKYNNDLVSHCKCDDALISYPPQMDCPWCGCGWLFTCLKCRKAFTFAIALDVEDSWETLAHRDLLGMGIDATNEAITDWVTSMQAYMSEIVIGQRYVALDGCIIPINATTLDFTGWRSQHQLKFVPQVQALKDPSIVESLLSNVNYWESRRINE